MPSQKKRRKGRPTPTQSRAARRSRRDRRKRILRLGAFAVISLVAVTFILALFAPGLNISIGGYGPAYQGQRVPIPDGYEVIGTNHLQTRDEPHPPYSSKPATSGWHYGVTAPWGIHGDAITDEVLVHNLEHAGVGVHYDCPEGCEELAADLARIAGPYQKVIVAPYPDMGTTIALTAWGRIDKLDVLDEERIVAFIEAHMNSRDAPEPLAP